MEPWLKAHLQKLGRWNTDGIGRRVSAGRCGGCGSVVLRGLDGDICAVPVAVDPAEVDAVGEYIALSNGRRTFDLVKWASKALRSYCLEPRRDAHIAKKRRYPVYAEHVCPKESR
jgi:hypothetical protein